MNFDLLQLHNDKADADINGSWIKASGSNLNSELIKLLQEIYQEKNQNNVARDLMKEINCSFSTSKRMLIRIKRKKVWVGLKIIIFLLDYWKKLFNISESVLEEKKGNIIKNIEFLKVGQGQSKPVKAPKKLSINLCKIAGAHAADGSLSPDYGVRLVDSSKEAVSKWISWLSNEFKIKIKLVKSRRENAFKTEKYNKVIARYLNIFFGFPFGKKTNIVREPKIIREASLKYRIAFALGVLTFDGSVSLDGLISLDSNSKQLILDLQDILVKDGIESNINKISQKYVLRIANSKTKFKPKLLNYFEKETPKWRRLAFIKGNLKYDKKYDRLYKELFYSSRIPYSELITICKKLGLFDYQALLNTIKGKYRISSTALLPYKDFLVRIGALRIIKKISFNQFKKAYLGNKKGLYAELDDSELKKVRAFLIKRFGSLKEASLRLSESKTTMWNCLSGNYAIPYRSFVKLNKAIDFEENNFSIIFLTNNKEIYLFNKDFKSTSLTSPFGDSSAKICVPNL